MLRVYSIKNDESQLMFQVNMNKIVDKELEISSFEFFMQHKFILITTLENQIFFLSPEFEIMEIQFTSNANISETLVFEHEKSVYICFGLSNGQYVVENL